jgi:hypothetical protein
MKDKTPEDGTVREILEVIYGVSLMLGPLILPIALLVKDVEGRWISFVATPIFVVVFLIKKKLKQ